MTWMVPLLRGANDIDILGPTPVRNADQSAYLDALLKLPEFFVGWIVRDRDASIPLVAGIRHASTGLSRQDFPARRSLVQVGMVPSGDYFGSTT